MALLMNSLKKMVYVLPHPITCLLLFYILTTNFALLSWKKKFYSSALSFNNIAHELTEDFDVRELISWFHGEFDNKVQALQDDRNGKPTASTGGHEFVTASFRPYQHLNNSIIAEYYYGVCKEKTFRYRLYHFEKNNDFILMKLYKPAETAERRLKEVNFDTNLYIPLLEDFELIDCDVKWNKKIQRGPNVVVNIWDPDQTIKIPLKYYPYYLGELVNGQCEIYSSRDPSIKLVVKDELKIWKDELWINDQVYTKDGTQIIGNIHGIPYKFMKK